MILFLFLFTILIFLSKIIYSTCKFRSTITKGGDATEKNSKVLILGISRNIIHLLIY